MLFQITENLTGQMVKLLSGERDTIGDLTDKSCFLTWETVEIRLDIVTKLFLENHSLQTNFTLTFAPRENPVIRGATQHLFTKSPLA
jgi:hypothetical protein